jgi:hypothetical protein
LPVPLLIVNCSLLIAHSSFMLGLHTLRGGEAHSRV